MKTKTGKTWRRRDLLTAVAAGGSVAAIADPSPAQNTKTVNPPDTIADLLIVGAGNAGIPAAIQAADLGARVLLIDKNPIVGGMLRISGGHVSGANTKMQIARGIEDSPAQHYRDAIRMGKYQNHSELLKLAVDNAAAMIDWLAEIGVDFTPESPFFEDDHEHYSAPRTYVGSAHARSILAPFENELNKRVERGSISLAIGVNAKRLLKAKDGRIIGVGAELGNKKIDYRAHAVVLATGGYGANRTMKQKYNPSALSATVICLPHANGDGIRMAEAVGADLTNMDKLIIFPAPVQDIGGGPTGARMQFPPDDHTDGIWVNRDGERFINERTSNPDDREQALLGQRDQVFFLIFDEHIRKNMSTLPVMQWDKKTLERKIARGVAITSADSLRGLAGKLGVNAAGLTTTVRQFNDSVASGADEAFGREALRFKLERPPFYGIRVGTALLITHGGIAVNQDLQVLHRDGMVIPGLYAVGETLGCGQLMGNAVLSGMSVGPAITLGRIAARNAYHYALLQNRRDLDCESANSRFLT